MQDSTIYTLGYAHWSIENVANRIDDLEAILVDVRHSPHSTKPGFTQTDLQARFGDRYVHLRAFGNVNYKGGPIELAAPEHGLRVVKELPAPPVLMCGCQNPASCHRAVVADFLSGHLKVPIEHLRAPSERAQPDLFDDPPDA